MNFANKYIDELLAIREKARIAEKWELADKIREYLDTKQVFVFDKKDEQLVYHRMKESRRDLIEQLKADAHAEKLFDAWLFSIRSSMKFKKIVLEKEVLSKA